jgi:hypothetical protein
MESKAAGCPAEGVERLWVVGQTRNLFERRVMNSYSYWLDSAPENDNPPVARKEVARMFVDQRLVDQRLVDHVPVDRRPASERLETSDGLAEGMG